MSNKELTRSYTHSTNYSRIKKVQLVSVTYNILACKISILSCQVATVNVVFGLCKEFIVKEIAVASYTPNRKLK